MRVGALGLAAAAVVAATPAAADVVVIDLSGSGPVFDRPMLALPGAGQYRFDSTSSIPVYLSLWAEYTYHWDIFVAPPPRPHEEYLDGNDNPVGDGVDDVRAALSWTFVVPETSYRFFAAGPEYEDRGVAEGTALYEVVHYEDPRVAVYAEDLGGASFDYRFKVTRLGPGGGQTIGVPEPATWVLLIAGFGLAGAALRRRRLAA